MNSFASAFPLNFSFLRCCDTQNQQLNTLCIRGNGTG